MATYTAQILIGEEHPNHGGLLPTSVTEMFLSENSIPAWLFTWLNVQPRAPLPLFGCLRAPNLTLRRSRDRRISANPLGLS